MDDLSIHHLIGCFAYVMTPLGTCLQGFILAFAFEYIVFMSDYLDLFNIYTFLAALLHKCDSDSATGTTLARPFKEFILQSLE